MIFIYSTSPSLDHMDRTSMLSVLTQGMELANELKIQLCPNPKPISIDTCDSLLDKILSSYDKALGLLHCMAPLSPTTQDSKDIQIQSLVFKKRKTMPKWSEQVRVCTGTEFEGQIDDGYHWRKYGQKDILGSIHPRAYYRCTHRNTQGCLATKQVQRADNDPSVFLVVYRGQHSCMRERIKQKKQDAIVPKKEEEEEEDEEEEEEEDCQHGSQTVMISTWPASLKTETQELNTKEEHFPCFSIPSTPINDAYENLKINFFPETSCSPPQFLSPATSESCFSLSPSQCPINGNFAFESDFAEIISVPTSATNTHFADLDSLDKVSFDSHLLEAFDCFQ